MKFIKMVKIGSKPFANPQNEEHFRIIISTTVTARAAVEFTSAAINLTAIILAANIRVSATALCKQEQVQRKK